MSLLFDWRLLKTTLLICTMMCPFLSNTTRYNLLTDKLQYVKIECTGVTVPDRVCTGTSHYRDTDPLEERSWLSITDRRYTSRGNIQSMVATTGHPDDKIIVFRTDLINRSNNLCFQAVILKKVIWLPQHNSKTLLTEWVATLNNIVIFTKSQRLPRDFSSCLRCGKLGFYIKYYISVVSLWHDF